MSNLIIVGIDPGIVHTGVVVMLIDPENREIHVEYEVFQGVKAPEIAQHVYGYEPTEVYIEDYNPRKNYNTDVTMIKAVGLLKDAMPKAKLIDNASVKSVVKPDVMRALGLWRYEVATHHDDLRSAARILIFGMLKNEEQRKLLSRIIQDHLDERYWNVEVLH